MKNKIIHILSYSSPPDSRLLRVPTIWTEILTLCCQQKMRSRTSITSKDLSK